MMWSDQVIDMLTQAFELLDPDAAGKVDARMLDELLAHLEEDQPQAKSIRAGLPPKGRLSLQEFTMLLEQRLGCSRTENTVDAWINETGFEEAAEDPETLRDWLLGAGLRPCEVDALMKGKLDKAKVRGWLLREK